MGAPYCHKELVAIMRADASEIAEMDSPESEAAYRRDMAATRRCESLCWTGMVERRTLAERKVLGEHDRLRTLARRLGAAR